MKIRTAIGLSACALIGVSVAACSPSAISDLLATTVDFPLNSLTFDVEAGQPTQRQVDFNVDTGSVTARSGTLAFDPETISLAAGSTSGKSQVAAQNIGDLIDSDSCLEVCDAAAAEFELDADSCNAVCSDGLLEMRLWVNDTASIEANCSDGEAYRVRAVIEGSSIASVAVEPEELTPRTIELINGGSFSACFQVLSPFTGQVVVEEMSVTIRP